MNFRFLCVRRNTRINKVTLRRQELTMISRQEMKIVWVSNSRNTWNIAEMAIKFTTVINHDSHIALAWCCSFTHIISFLFSCILFRIHFFVCFGVGFSFDCHYRNSFIVWHNRIFFLFSLCVRNEKKCCYFSGACLITFDICIMNFQLRKCW